MLTYVPPARGIITHRATLDDIKRFVSAIVMQGESEAQRERLRHLQEEMLRLLRKRDRIDDLRVKFKVNAFGLRIPTEKQIDELYELTQTFFQGVYAAMGALHSFVRHFYSWQVVEQHQPPQKSVKVFLEWLKHVPVEDVVIDELLRAREMRTMFDHPDQRPFDWGSTKDTAGLFVLYLFGTKGQSGATPDYAEYVMGAPGDWQVLAPSEVSVTNALAIVLREIAHASHIRMFKSEEEMEAWAAPDPDVELDIDGDIEGEGQAR